MYHYHLVLDGLTHVFPCLT